MPTKKKSQARLARETEQDRALLAKLGLGPAELTALKNQGCVVIESDGQGKSISSCGFGSMVAGVQEPWAPMSTELGESNRHCSGGSKVAARAVPLWGDGIEF